MGFLTAGTLFGYILFFKVHLASEELNSALRGMAATQADIERRLSILDGK
eukprot:CAMPEP_0169228178 /NCGR_PEP_ID=MMETSP1016-20121227/24699_1 /TAXON_ID=342587 /ORGANISM="Karlodinium micrum, Strain CCMP2283" /LENGTH=49 /DNA_ID=CAMNT_0009306947 /DNA_START=230 /DNA_END=379 /DNA_ORIENTATION=-